MLQQSDSGTMKQGAVPLQASKEEPVPVDIQVQVIWSPTGLTTSVEPVCVAGCIGRVRWALEGAPAGASLEISFSAEAIAVFDSLAVSSGPSPAIEARVKQARETCQGNYKAVVQCPPAALADQYREVSYSQYSEYGEYSGTGGETGETGEPTDPCETTGRIDFTGWPPPS